VFPAVVELEIVPLEDASMFRIDYMPSIPDITKAVSRPPDSARGARRLAMKVGLLALALLVSTAACTAPPAKSGDAKAHLDRATTLYEKGDLDGAIAELREAIRLKPDDALAHYNLGGALEAKGEKLAALAEYRKASELEPGNQKFRADYERLSKQPKK